MNGGMRVAAYEKSKSVKLKSISTMTEGTIWRQILLFSIPLILGNLLQQMYNTVDSIIVGNFVGSNALAAVGSSTSLICLLIAFSMGASAGAGVIVSQFYGAGDENGVQRSAHTALMLALILGIVLTIAGIVFSPAILRWMRTPEEVMNQSVLYLRIYSYGLVFNVIYNMAAGILNAVGNSRRSLMYLAVASFSNIFLDLWLIGGMHMGVEGAAIATDISQVLSCIFALWFLMRVPDIYRINPKKLSIDRTMAGRIIQVGLPTAIQNTVISFSNVLVQSGVNGFGASATLRFGVSPQGNPDNDRNEQYTDLSVWLTASGADAVVDYLCPQIYWGYGYTLSSGSTRFAFENITAEWLALPRAESTALYFGLGAYRVGVGDGGANADSVSQ